MEKPCDLCGAMFDPSTRNSGKGRQRFCSKACRSTAHNRQHWHRHHTPIPEQELERACIVCSVKFKTDKYHPKALTCSVKCNESRQNASRRREKAAKYDALPERECAECSALFKPHILATNWGKYCSQVCADKFRVRESGRKRFMANGRDKRLNSPAWKAARAIVLERDQSTCKLCGDTERRMSVHHLFNEHDHSPDNLITVCGPCHHDLHSFVLKQVDGEVVISGPIFDYLGITVLKVKQ